MQALRSHCKAEGGTKMKRSPLKRKTPLRAKSGLKPYPWPRESLKPRGERPALRARSTKRAAEERKYNAEVKEFLSTFPSPCIVMATIFNSRGYYATEVHHCAGREGDLLRFKPFWLAVSRSGHDWIHANHDLARERGWIFEARKIGPGRYVKSGTR